MLDLNQLPSLKELKDIDQRFKAFAGPGAGKTTWLIGHIKKVAKESRRLGLTRKIACITYTNVAAEQLINGLDFERSQIEVSTIHSFLYKNIIKPFAHLIAKDENGDDLFNISELQGHEEHIPYSDRIRRWFVSMEQCNGKKANHYGYLNSAKAKPKLIKYLSSLDFRLDVNGNIELYNKKYVDLQIPKANRELWLYKKKYWLDGIMHHEDVLYFAYYILNKSPRILEFVRNKYPYIFIDEFQDTTALQTIIVKSIGEGDTTIGVIGDLAQSIYKFAGAVRSDFQTFLLSGMTEYKLEQNFRSSQSIIDYLNTLREDIQQKGYEDTKDGDPVTVLVGSHEYCYRWTLNNVNKDITVLAEEHKDLENVRSETVFYGDNLVKKMFAEESNSKRVRYIHSLMIGYKYLERKNIKQALNSIGNQIKSLNPRSSRFAIQKASVYLLEQLKFDENKNLSLYDFYLQSNIYLENNYHFKLNSRLSNGAPKTFYMNNKLKDVLRFVKIDAQFDDKIRTIHSSKGAEFDDVMVCMKSDADMERYIMRAKEGLNGDADEVRKYYVAFSRAKKRLFLSVPEMKDKMRNYLQSNKIKILILPVENSIVQNKTLFDE